MEQDGGVSLSWLRPRILALTEKFSFERLGTGMRWGRLADLGHRYSDRLCGLGSLVIGRLSLSLAARDVADNVIVVVPGRGKVCVGSDVVVLDSERCLMPRR